MEQKEYSPEISSEERISNIDFSLIDEIPDGLDEFKVDEVYLEQCRNELMDTEFDQSVFDRWAKGLVLWFDKFILARDSRVSVGLFRRLTGREPKHQLDTTTTFYRADRDCHPSHPKAMARLLVRAKRLIINCREAILNLQQQMADQAEKYEATIADLQQQLAEALSKSLEPKPMQVISAGGAPAALPAEEGKKKRKKKEEQELTPDELKEAEWQDTLAVKKAEAAQMQQELRANAPEILAQRLMDDKPLAFTVLAELPNLKSTPEVIEYLETKLVNEKKISRTGVYEGKLCQIYALYVGYKIDGTSLQNALRKHFNPNTPSD